MMILSVEFMKTTAPHIYIHVYTLKYNLLYVSVMSEGVETYNCTCDNKFSILGESFTGIVKNARVLSHRCGITYDATVSILPPEIHVDHTHVHM